MTSGLRPYKWLFINNLGEFYSCNTGRNSVDCWVEVRGKAGGRRSAGLEAPEKGAEGVRPKAAGFPLSINPWEADALAVGQPNAS